ncbi:MAG: lactate utilization protein [Pseudomonadales bacterium]|nr:lactate utilization protein [Pseudomonadales bacterium]
MNNALINQLVQQLKINVAGVVCCEFSQLPHQLMSFFDQQKLPKSLITNLDLDIGMAIEITKGRATGDEAVGLSQAIAAISETGTLVLASSASNPTSINFLVDHHLVLIEAKDIVANLTDAMNKLSKMDAFDQRALNFISGPSRTADIEQTIQLGAHGPRNLWVFILI